MTENIQFHTFPNGLRLLYDACDSEVVFCGYVIAAGTRHEDSRDTGMAHFIEHMTFKGTERRRAFQINNGLERVGGDLNAFTTKQETVYTAAVQAKDFLRAADLLTDIVFHSSFPQTEIDREVEVICDEIDSYRDAPAELIFDEYETMLFRDHALGRDILGAPERLRNYTTADARRFVDGYYVPSNVVFYYSGKAPFAQVVRQMERLTLDLPAVSPSPLSQPLTPYVPEVRRVEKDTHQAHVVIGNRTVSGMSEDRYAMVLLNNMIGGPGMNSRLNLALREKAGLVYSVDSSLSLFPDTGIWNIYFGCDMDDVERCRRIVARELRRLTDAPLSDRQLAAAKKQLLGQVRIGRENRESRIQGLAKNYSLYGVTQSLNGIYEAIEAISAPQLQRLAEETFSPDLLTTLIYS